MKKASTSIIFGVISSDVWVIHKNNEINDLRKSYLYKLCKQEKYQDFMIYVNHVTNNNIMNLKIWKRFNLLSYLLKVVFILVLYTVYITQRTIPGILLSSSSAPATNLQNASVDFDKTFPNYKKFTLKPFEIKFNVNQNLT